MDQSAVGALADFELPLELNDLRRIPRFRVDFHYNTVFEQGRRMTDAGGELGASNYVQNRQRPGSQNQS